MPSAPAFVPDDRQREAIEHIHGPVMVVAGAGTGKTTVLTRRIAHLVRQGHARPDEILALTYTENAAAEMRQRLAAELGGSDASGLQVFTFHAYCNGVIQRCGKNFAVLDDKDLWIYLRRRIRELHLDYFVRAANTSQFLDSLLEFFSRCQDEFVGPKQYSEYVDKVERGEVPVPSVSKSKSKEKEPPSDEEIVGRCREIARVFTTVDKMLRKDNYGTFGHMISGAHGVLCSDTAVLAFERPRARFVLVDEFQDANYAQVKVLQMLAGDERNVFAVGDPDQAVYRFRGASSAAFSLFLESFPEAKLVALQKNRRSTSSVLRCAFEVIRLNPDLKVGSGALTYRRSQLISAREEDAAREGRQLPNPPVDAVVLTAKEAESSDLLIALRQRHNEGCRWDDMGILYRQHSHRDEIARQLAEENIPFTIENMDVTNTPEVRDLFACIGAVVSDADSASLLRVAALPQFTIDPEKLRDNIRRLPRDKRDANVALVLREIEGGRAVLDALQRSRDDLAKSGAKGVDAVRTILRNFGLDGSTRPILAAFDFISKWENKPTTKVKTLPELVEYISLFREASGAIPLLPREDDAVHLMTAHAAKGLEFKHVFILRAISPSFPASYRPNLIEFPRELVDKASAVPDDNKELNAQEERRLFYVAMTRACDTLTIYARQGKGKTDPTPPGFLRELIKTPTLKPWFQTRATHAFQTEMFAQEAPLQPTESRVGRWLTLPPAVDLSTRLSATAVQTYTTCPLQFKLEREWRVPREAPAPMQYGAAMHRALHAYGESVRAGRPLAEPDLVDIFCNELTQAKLQDRYQHDLYESQGRVQLHEFMERTRRLPLTGVLHTEESFDVKMGNSTINGRIDRIDQRSDGTVAITDYKTGEPLSQDNADESLQLSIYAIAAKEKWGYQVSSLVFYNLKENAPVSSTRSEAELQAARQQVTDVAASIAAGRFTATPGRHCRFCPYNNVCPATEVRMHSLVEETSAGGNGAKRSRKSRTKT